MKKQFLVASLMAAVGFSGASQAALVTVSDMGSLFLNAGLKSTYDFEPLSGFAANAYIGLFGPIAFDAKTEMYSTENANMTSGKYAMTGWDGTFSDATLDFTRLTTQAVIGFGFYGLDLTVDEVIRVTVEFAHAGTQSFDISLENIEKPLRPTYFGLYDDQDSILNINISGTDSTGATRAWLLDDLTLVTAPTTVPVPAGIWLFGSGLAGLLSLSRKRKTA